MKVPIGYKFIFGFLAVVATAAFVPGAVDVISMPEWLRTPLGVLVAMVIGLIIGAVFTKGFTRNFTHLTRMAQRISRGDLSSAETERLGAKFFPDETTELEEALVLVFTDLRGLVGHLKDTVKKLAEAQETLNGIIGKGHETSSEVAAGTGRIFDGALEQSRHVENSSVMVREVAEMADSAASKVTDTANASQKVNVMAHRGATSATSAIEKMEAVFRGIEKSASAATRLKEKLGDIPKILDVITHISRQTDLLALNATIEASKAGEHGRGFAMVAEEVRRFADNTSRSVEDVSMIVRELKTEVEHVVATANEGTASVREGRDDIRKIREILGGITDYTSDVAEKAGVVLSLTQKQKAKAEKTAVAIEEVARIARENLSSTEAVDRAVERHGAAIEETLDAAKKLSALSDELNGVVANFKL
ncbi:MAG: methyl-accepting chemotaxis protein [Deltaproteobacteria bacterium]|nr:methyl-accepting chemotaxis protein [Deltaproteobacteria bacterium]